MGVLADSIDEVADQHRHTCDLANPNSPQSTVAIVRVQDDRLDYLVLADTYVVLDPVGTDPQVITDSREVSVRARRNKPGGYWVAKDDPRAAAEAVAGGAMVADLDAVALLTKGGGARSPDSSSPDDATVAYCDLRE